VRWRRDRLVESGFPVELASALAGDARYDLHELIGLVGRGCMPELAVRILAPLEEGRGLVTDLRAATVIGTPVTADGRTTEAPTRPATLDPESCREEQDSLLALVHRDAD
jgi:hypothetical protein